MGSLISVGDSGRTHIVFDNILKETFTQTAQVTNHPIGSRSTPADHRLDEPDIVEIVGRITESPFSTVDGPAPLFLNDYTGELAEDGSLALLSSLGAEGNRPRALATDLFIREFKTQLWEYSSASMGLKRNLALVSWDYDIVNARHVDFNIKLQAVEFIEAQRVELPMLKVLKKAPEACPQTGTGDKSKTAVGTTGPPSTIKPKDVSLWKAGNDNLLGVETDPQLVKKLNDLFGTK